MAKMNKYDRQHWRNQAAIERQVEDIYRTAVMEAAALGASIRDFNPDRLFSFSDYPTTRKKIEKLLSDLQSGLETIIVNGIRSEWTLANNKNDELAKQVFGDSVGKLTQAQYRRYFSTNGSARDAFIKRKTDGLGLSDRVWKYTNQFKMEIELGLDLGIRSGRSADGLSRDLRSYLQHPDKLFRRVRNEHGQLVLSQRAKAYHPGKGVYRSSYKNARRLAATETNIAYRTADYERWQQLDFVVGIEIKLSGNHPVRDICDDLKGCYTKDFKFTGWHPYCRCHVISIIKTEEELDEDIRSILAGEPLNGKSVNRVDDVPVSFKDWVDSNAGRIAGAAGRGTLPYFIRDNHCTAITTYARYKTDEDYMNVALNYLTWGVKATHRDHNFDKRKGWYETAVQDAGYDTGHRVILDKEDHTRMKVRNTEGTWDGMKFEIAAAETGTSNNIRNALKHCASKPDCEVAIIFVTDDIGKADIRYGLAKYNGLRGNRQWRQFKAIYAVDKNGNIKHLPPISED